ADRRHRDVHNYLELAAITLLYYDYFLTLPQEVACIWPRPLARPSILFFLNRYVAFIGNIIVSVFSFTNLAEGDKVRSTSSLPVFAGSIIRNSCWLGRGAYCSSYSTKPWCLLAMRIMALYGNSRKVVLFILGSGLVLGTLACWSLFGQHTTPIEGVKGCHISTSDKTAVRDSDLAVAWEAQAVFDLLVFAMTVRKTWTSRGHIARGDIGLVDLVLRDGAFFLFAVVRPQRCPYDRRMLTRTQPILKGVLSTLASCVSITMMSRLMLNLHEAVGSDTSSRAGTTTLSMIFTTRIEPGAQKGEYDYDDNNEARRVRFDEPGEMDIELVSVGRAV
ncbi:hypothetical protein FA95DRAFT_1499876, partial [Auriscalpium vulgare]